MAAITPEALSRTGKVITAGHDPTATTGDTWANTGNELLWISNATSSTELEVTVKNREVPRAGKAASLLDETIAVDHGETVLAGPFPPGWFNDDDGNVTFICDSVTSIKVEVYSMPR